MEITVNRMIFTNEGTNPGNSAQDTEGCLRVGQKKMKNRVANSRPAFDPLLQRIQAGTAGEKVFIDIVNQPIAAA